MSSLTLKHWYWIQGISFQLIWLACVVGGNAFSPVALGLVLLHLCFSPMRSDDLRILPLAFIGIATDALLWAFGWYAFATPPWWLPCLWFGFVLNFAYSLHGLRKLRWYAQALIGCVGGSYAYAASWKLGAVSFPHGPNTLMLIALIWGLLLPLLVKLDLQYRSQSVSA